MDFFAFPDETKQAYILYTAEIKNDSESNIEKDVWVTKVLSILFKSSIKDSLAFKGGTSLSKGWEIIKRFSEDVDLVIDPKMINPLLPDAPSKRELKKFRKDTEVYVIEYIKPLLEKELFSLNVTIEIVSSEIPDPTILKVSYKPLFEQDTYIKKYIQLEISSRATMEPMAQLDIRSEVCSCISAEDEELDDDVFPVNIVESHKTCLEKVLLLHEEFSKTAPRSERMSRHLYDLYKLNAFGVVDKIIANVDLYCSLIRHRFLFNRITELDYSAMSPEYISIVPPARVVKDWEKDYEEMKVHMINEEVDIPWSSILSSANEITEKIRGMSLSKEAFLQKTELDYFIALYSDLVGKVKNRQFKEVATLLSGRELTSSEKRCINEVLTSPGDRRNFEIITKKSIDPIAK